MGCWGQTLFVVEVVAFGLESEVRRPYEDFDKLHADISQFIRSLPSEVRLRLSYALPPLPANVWFVDSARVLEERRTKLEALLQKLLLQPEIVNDPEERLWRFLRLHTAVTSAASLLSAKSCGPWLQHLWEASAEGEGLMPLRHSSVEDALHRIISNTLGESHELSDGDKRDSMIFACEILHRIFDSGKEAVARPAQVLRSRVEVLVSLTLCTCSEPAPTSGSTEAAREDTSGGEASEGGQERPALRGPRVRDSAATALLALARADRAAWQQALCASLSAETAQNLVAVAESGCCASVPTAAAGDGAAGAGKGSCDGAELSAPGPLSSERLVAELLLRGFDGAVVERFIEPELSNARKQLLNALFSSQDLSVRLMVGLLLARLLCEGSYAEAAKAELGLGGLCRELAPRAAEFAGAGLRQVLLEDDVWAWLSGLVASSHSMVSGFALLVVVHAVEPCPELIMRTPGLREALARLVEPEADATVRSLAARMLLATYRRDDESIPANAALVSAVCGALALSAERSVARQADRYGTLGAGTAEARAQYGVAASTQELVSLVCQGAAGLSEEAGAWRNALVIADGALEVAEHVNAACVACLGSHRAYWGTAVSNLENEAAAGGTADPLAELQAVEQEASVEKSRLEAETQHMEALLKEKMDLTRKVSECNEEVHRWFTASNEAKHRETCADAAAGIAFDVGSELAYGVQPGSACEGQRAQECWQKHRNAVETLKVLRARVEEVDVHLQELSQALPSMREAAEARTQSVKDLTAQADEAKRRHTAMLLEWGKVLDVGSTCDAELRNFEGRLEEAQGSLETERLRRASMRGAIRGLVASLVALDGHLESLEAKDSEGVAA